MNILSAANEDIWQILELLSSASPDAVDAEESGFICSKLTAGQLAQLIANQEIYIARNSLGVIGWIWFSVPPPGLLSHIKLQNSTFKLPGDLIWIDAVVVSNRVKRMGIGSALYSHLSSIKSKSSLITALYESPVPNLASKRFHLNMGFTRIGILSKKSAMGKTDIQSGVYFKPVGSDADA